MCLVGTIGLCGNGLELLTHCVPWLEGAEMVRLRGSSGVLLVTAYAMSVCMEIARYRRPH